MPGSREVRLEAQGGLEMGFGFVAAVLMEEGKAEVELSLGIAGIELQDLEKAGDGLVVLALGSRVLPEYS